MGDFRVEEAWKGVSKESVSVYGYGLEPSCAIELEEGRSYLVYARRTGGEGSLETNYCDATRLLVRAEADLRMLGPSTPLVDTGGPPLTPSSLW